MRLHRDKRTIILLFGCFFALISIFYIVYIAYNKFYASASLPAPAQTEQAKPVPGSARVDTSVAAISSAQKQETAAVPVTLEAPVSGNLAQITALRAKLDQVKVEAAISQELEKIQPKVLPTAPPQSPATPTPAPQLQLRLSEPTAPHASPAVVSVQGLDGHASATIRTDGKTVVVRPGDRFNGGIVKTVSRSGVTIQRGKSTTNLTFED